MRRGASVVHESALSSLPLGARISRMLCRGFAAALLIVSSPRKRVFRVDFLGEGASNAPADMLVNKFSRPFGQARRQVLQFSEGFAGALCEAPLLSPRRNR